MSTAIAFLGGVVVTLGFSIVLFAVVCLGPIAKHADNEIEKERQRQLRTVR